MERDFRLAVAGSADPDLVEEIMRLIGRYCDAIGVVPSAIELRDTMLAVAALSHLKAGVVISAGATSADEFAEAALETFRDVTGVAVASSFCRETALRVRH